jgi:hypothetical protein
MSALSPEADMLIVGINVCYVPNADINHHLFRTVDFALVRLVQLGRPVEIRPSTPWHWLASHSAPLHPLLL